jgi:glycosyltransferase involved in cell wall biosynthesis
MKVLLVYKTCETEGFGGVESFLKQLATGLVKAGVVVDVFCLSSCARPVTIERNGYRIHRAKLSFEIASSGFSIFGIKLFRKLANEADIIHYQFPWPFADLMHFISFIKKPYIITYHSDIIKQKNLAKLYRPLMNKFFLGTKAIVATSQNYKCSSKVLQKYLAKTVVIPIGLEDMQGSPPKIELIEKWRSEFGEKFFLFIGSFRYYKGLDYLIEAVSDKKHKLIILGSGAQESKIKVRISDSKITNIKLVGNLAEEDKYALLTLCRAVILPSHLRSEAYGISLVEGAMFGKPLISCDIGTGTSFINQHRKTGLVVASSDPLALREAINIIAVDDTIANTMGMNARKHYIDSFTEKKMIESYVELYRQIMPHVAH